jgi:hypothetical protein
MADERRPEELAKDDASLRAAETLARWMDGRLVDPLLGLFLPGLGDLVSSLLGLYPIALAWRRRVPKVLLARMLLNLAADAAGGSIPIVGDVWDFFFRAHARNHQLLRARLAQGETRARWTDWLVIGGAVLALLAALSLPVIVAIAAWRILRRV